MDISWQNQMLNTVMSRLSVSLLWNPAAKTERTEFEESPFLHPFFSKE